MQPARDRERSGHPLGGRRAIAGPVTYRISITPTALKMLQGITNRDIQDTIRKRIRELAIDSEKQGKALRGALRGFRSVRAYQQRYRILYRVDRDEVIVTVVAVGIRREGDRQDIYDLAVKLLRARLLDSP